MVGICYMIVISFLFYPVIIEISILISKRKSVGRIESKINYFNKILRKSKTPNKEILEFDETYNHYSIIFSEINKKYLGNIEYKKVVNQYYAFYRPLFKEFKRFLKRFLFVSFIFLFLIVGFLIIGAI